MGIDKAEARSSRFLSLIFILISNRLRVQFSFSYSQYFREFVRTIYIFVLLGIFGYNSLGIQTCKNIMKCNDFVNFSTFSRTPRLEIAFIALDSTNSLYNNRFSRMSLVFTSKRDAWSRFLSFISF